MRGKQERSIANTIKKQYPTLFHISFNSKLEGVWKPTLPSGGNDVATSELTEPAYPRICLSPTLEQCFWAIYPNVSKYFEIKNYPYIDMTVYAPVITSSTKIVSNEVIVKKQLVHDAFITGEVFITTPVMMKKHSEIRILNCTKNKEVWYYPFGMQKYPKRFLAHEVNILTLKTFL